MLEDAPGLHRGCHGDGVVGCDAFHGSGRSRPFGRRLRGGQHLQLPACSGRSIFQEGPHTGLVAADIGGDGDAAIGFGGLPTGHARAGGHAQNTWRIRVDVAPQHVHHHGSAQGRAAGRSGSSQRCGNERAGQGGGDAHVSASVDRGLANVRVHCAAVQVDGHCACSGQGRARASGRAARCDRHHQRGGRGRQCQGTVGIHLAAGVDAARFNGRTRGAIGAVESNGRADGRSARCRDGCAAGDGHQFGVVGGFQGDVAGGLQVGACAHGALADIHQGVQFQQVERDRSGPGKAWGAATSGLGRHTHAKGGAGQRQAVVGSGRQGGGLQRDAVHGGVDAAGHILQGQGHAQADAATAHRTGHGDQGAVVFSVHSHRTRNGGGRGLAHMAQRSTDHMVDAVDRKSARGTHTARGIAHGPCQGDGGAMALCFDGHITGNRHLRQISNTGQRSAIIEPHGNGSAQASAPTPTRSTSQQHRCLFVGGTHIQTGQARAGTGACCENVGHPRLHLARVFAQDDGAGHARASNGTCAAQTGSGSRCPTTPCGVNGQGAGAQGTGLQHGCPCGTTERLYRHRTGQANTGDAVGGQCHTACQGQVVGGIFSADRECLGRCVGADFESPRQAHQGPGIVAHNLHRHRAGNAHTALAGAGVHLLQGLGGLRVGAHAISAGLEQGVGDGKLIGFWCRAGTGGPRTGQCQREVNA